MIEWFDQQPRPKVTPLLVKTGWICVVKVTVWVDPAECAQTQPTEVLFTWRTRHLVAAIHFLQKEIDQDEKERISQSWYREKVQSGDVTLWQVNLFVTTRGSHTWIFVPQRGQLLQFSFSQSLLKDSSTAFWMTPFPKRCSINFWTSAVADRYSSLRFRNSSAAQETKRWKYVNLTNI